MRPTVVLLACVLAVAACKRKNHADQEAKKVTASSTDDATEPLIDEDYRFRIDWPGRGWKILRERDARKLNQDAVAGLKHDTTNMVVIVEHTPGSRLDEFVTLIAGNMMIEDKHVEQEPAQVGDTPAIRIDVTGKLNDAPVRYRGLVLLHQEHAYQVLAYTLGHDDDAELDKALAAFSLVPGPVQRRAVATTVADQTGVGWRVAGGVFESAASRLRLRPPAGWRLAVGAELEQMNTSAEIGLVATELDAFLVVIPEAIPGTDHAGYAAARRAESLGEATALDSFAATMLGGKVELMRARSEQGIIIELLHGTVFDRDRAYQVVGWYPAALRDRAEPSLIAAIASFELLDDAGLAAVAAALEKAPDRQNEIGAGYALRAGVYQDFNHRVRWRKPPGHWRIAVGQEARAGNADALLTAEEVTSGLFAQLIVEPAASWEPAGYHRAIVDNLVGSGLTVTGSGQASIAGAPASFTELDMPTEGAALHYRVTTAIVDDVAVQAIAWGVAGAWPGDEAVAAVAAGLERAPEPEIDDGRTYRDRRLGFAMALPPGWTRTDQTPEPVRALATIQRWRSGLAEILVVAIFAVDQPDEDWMLDLLEQNMRDSGAEISDQAPKTRTGELAGRPARIVSWGDRAEVRLINRDKTYYGVVAVDPRGGGKAAGIAADAFSLLD